MYRYIKIITLFVSMFVIQIIEAQESTINYTLTSDQVTIAEQTLGISSIITRSDNTITWEQSVNGKTNTSTFTVTNTTGNWDSANNTGALEHTLDLPNSTAVFSLEGDNNGMVLKMTIQPNGQSSQLYTLNINTISYQ